MATVRIATDIAASPAVCFDLARSVDAHIESASETNERAVAGVTKGLLELGDEVTWQAKHFGIRQELTSRITAFDRPRHFRDVMVRGAFQRFEHDHYFEAVPSGTRMIDVFDFTVPFGFVGTVVERLFLKAYMSRFLEKRAQALKRIGEASGGRSDG